MKSLFVLGLVILVVPMTALAQPLLPLPDSGTMTWGNWTFQYEVGDANTEGLVIRNVKWKGTSVLAKGSLPVIRVKYRGDASGITAGCGPYRDRIHWGNMELIKGATTHVTARIFNNELLEVAIFAQIGGYNLFQAFYFSTSGRLEPVLYSNGWSCGDDDHENDHKHHPYWRLDFDVEGPRNEAWVIRTKNNNKVQTFKFPKEWNDWKLDDDKDIAWSINKVGSNKHVLIRSPSNETRDGQGSPWFGFCTQDADMRIYHGSEDEEWPFGKTQQLGYIDPVVENFTDSDIVFWSIGHLTHTWSQADHDKPEWHSRGLIVDVNW